MLYNGEEGGSGGGPEVDVAVDPLGGTRLTALGQPNAIAGIALAERGGVLFPGAAASLEEIAGRAPAPGAMDSASAAASRGASGRAMTMSGSGCSTRASTPGACCTRTTSWPATTCSWLRRA